MASTRRGLDVELWVLEVNDLNNIGEQTSKEAADGAITVVGFSEQDRWEHPTFDNCKAIFADALPDVTVVEPNDAEEVTSAGSTRS